jgi:hypothetical protein
MQGRKKKGEKAFFFPFFSSRNHRPRPVIVTRDRGNGWTWNVGASVSIRGLEGWLFAGKLASKTTTRERGTTENMSPEHQN